MNDSAVFKEESAGSVQRIESPVSKMDMSATSISDSRDSAPESPSSSMCSTPPAVVTVSSNHTQPFVRQNHVSQVMLHGVPIVSLFIDAKERLCLAQISNTHLKDYSYNEIHNRRVALGITCVQCTPVQLEILRRAGAMPVSSRRCGMITKREAERLVKSFLEDNSPPKLPEDFSFDVIHDCGWGCRGNFEPSRYNSSRAKCIKCRFCNIYFSPNKFIFHFHRAPDAKYSHPDAANFNSWRRHLKLVEGTADDLVFIWEDVKAMFNGGSRKRTLSMATAVSTSNHNSVITKKAKVSTENPYITKPYSSQYPSFNLFSPHTKQYPYGSMNSSYGYSAPQTKDSTTDPSKAVLPHSPWATQSNIAFPSYDLLWANTLALSRSGAIRNGYYPNMSKQMMTDTFNRGSSHADKRNSKMNDGSDPKSQNDRLSAFRPVGRSAHVQSGDSEKAESCGSCPDEEENEEIDVTYDTEDEHLVNSEEEVMKSECDENKNCEKLSMDTKVTEETPVSQICDSKESETIIEEPNNNKEKPAEVTVNCEDTTPEERTMAESDQSDGEVEKDCIQYTREELFEQLRKEIDNRKKIEREVTALRETYSEQANREKSYRDEMAHQLQAVKDTLSTELEQERKIRFALQQKLKEAHDALHSFSCKMLTSRQCDECSYKESPLPR